MKKIIDLNGVRGSFIKLSSKTEQERNLFLSCLTLELVNNRKKILTANEKDVKNAYKNNLSEVFIQRLKLDSEGFNSIVEKVKQVQSLESGIGEIMEKKTNDSGLILHKVRVPIGTILIVYESRPEVTIDVACLCIKSGNTALLKGGSEALNTNIALYVCIQQALSRSSLPLQSISFIQSKNRTIIKTLLKQNNYIDLVIARGGYKMVKYIQSHSTIPVLAHSSGGARIYIDKSADLSIVEKIIINAKVSKPAACNSLDTIVIHTDIKDKILNTIQKSFEKNNVKIIDDEWDEEFLSMRVSIKIVNSLNEAIRFINAHSKKHSEGIIAQDKTIIRQFCQSIDAAVIFVNSSTRLNDGYIFGLGSEMGIATGKLHARGPVGLKELSIYKWIIYGQGHIRE
ncbi:glutamate-5-semialdehyde dehydrogenase [Candidatus Roizmanbacteria bacterium CG11_big_fil_rev_8_21_14_0_20_37_16]|uniref:Gamma-glutamyl phosphate reductase n=1 Tax=Candidatus Roizmanbacteria bacterium CG11_big_fil_rev_8_21_14_0_20_37_16 TaxID=1974857 RepID=A0A2H0KM66_9BACT|nr:MAG: glutamate-5-semialdehyde dehydrogenase [Candidatus Roizmanbacteria bacterium CG11_big_fil_rev_8_21_14_0_20_37_16]